MPTEGNDVRWLFADQLGPHFLDGDDQRVLLVESRRVFARRRFHRQKAHLVLSAMRHRAAELGERCTFRQADRYRDVFDHRPRAVRGPLTVSHPTTFAARDFVQSLDRVQMLPARGYATEMDEFARWAAGRRGHQLRMEDFYRGTRRRLDLLMDGDEPLGGRWNYDAENREPPPKPKARPELTDPDQRSVLGVPGPWWPDEDEIDEQVRADLDRWEADGDVTFVGRDGPRQFPATRTEALTALRHFLDHRLRAFGRYEDAMMSGDPWMAHSLLSATINLGLLDPVEVVHAAESAYRDRPDQYSLAAVEGFVRQVIGWREYMWQLYWWFGPEYRHLNELRATKPLPKWFVELDADAVQARCLSDVLGDLRDHGWVHHIPRLMVLGNYALQRGWRPDQLTDWFHRSFVDGYDWVMLTNVVGMSQYADGGRMVTKPYAGGGAYINRMSDYCGQCPYSPTVRVGEQACPFAAGYWWFVHRHRDRFAGNHRMRQAIRGLDRLRDLEALVEQEEHRGSRGP
ncbi:cryptochrome/photolyase family protein [Nakamurella leprariae]|uniref:cryptochrome/photolyase family protein n=1 Tax=Nakamurella leprariae TaxID=2803911 RepID=UPI002E2A4FD4|nr:cryptochrome/photolyase family protein [Nakamurella leprariae]